LAEIDSPFTDEISVKRLLFPPPDDVIDDDVRTLSPFENEPGDLLEPGCSDKPGMENQVAWLAFWHHLLLVLIQDCNRLTLHQIDFFFH